MSHPAPRRAVGKHLPLHSTLTTQIDVDRRFVYWSTWNGETFENVSTFDLLRESAKYDWIRPAVIERFGITELEFNAARDTVRELDERRGAGWMWR